MDFIKILIIAITIEAIWENCKIIWQKGKFSGEKIGVLITGILVSVCTGIDFFSLIGIPIVVPYVGSYVGQILTGTLVSRGANYIHDLINRINSVRSK